MKIFTDEEELVLKRTDENYKYIARDKDGDLYIYKKMPYRDENVFNTERSNFCLMCNKYCSDIFFKNVTWENSPIQFRDDESLEGQKIKSKKIEELANGAEKDIEILNEMYEKYAEIKDGDTVDDDTVINNICFNLINAQTDIDELQSQIQQLQERN